MLASGPLAAAGAVDSNLVPTLVAIGVALLGGGGIAALITALGQRKNYVQSSYKDRSDTAVKDADDQRARAERAEYSRDRWRDYAFDLQAQLASEGVTPSSIAPTDHPSEAP